MKIYTSASVWDVTSAITTSVPGVKWTPSDDEPQGHGWVSGFLSTKYSFDDEYKQVSISTGLVTNKPCHHIQAQIVMHLFKTLPNVTVIWAEKKKFSAEFKSYTTIAGSIQEALFKKGYKCNGKHTINAAGNIIGLSPSVKQLADKMEADILAIVQDATAAKPEPKSEPIVVPKPPKGWPEVPTEGDVPQDGESQAVPVGTVRDIYTAVCSYYALDEIIANLPNVPRRRLDSHGGIADHLFRREIRKIHAEYGQRFARNLFDYLTVASIGEARHAKVALGLKGGPPKSRKDVYIRAHQHDPRHLLAVSQWVFGYHLKGGSYGGPKWAKIAQTAMEYLTKPYYRNFPLVYADHCVDLAHNGGLAFNKGYIFSMPSKGEAAYMKVLDVKRKGSLLQSDCVLTLGPKVLHCLKEAEALGIVTGLTVTLEKVTDNIIPTIKWGMAPLDATANVSPTIPGYGEPATATKPSAFKLETYPKR